MKVFFVKGSIIQLNKTKQLVQVTRANIDGCGKCIFYPKGNLPSTNYAPIYAKYLCHKALNESLGFKYEHKCSNIIPSGYIFKEINNKGGV